MVCGSRAGRPKELAILVAQRQVIDAGVTLRHAPIWRELPELIAVEAEPVARRIVPRIAEADGHAVAANSPQLLGEPIVVFAGPFAGQKRDDLLSTPENL